ncbi:hypothetical protein [Peribacillus alkalitolerans]|uniref:hypothetical protein n=1 Tax=Peribacillus alkalitolerans TaxID=1550385 RepID=UPI0013D84FAF|nr:hypothetical protein [Peribacillus alkalitolerans]
MKNKDKILKDRNDRSKAFEKNWNEQKERDQVVMPIDDLPLEEIKTEKKEERDNKGSKDTSTSEAKEME